MDRRYSNTLQSYPQERIPSLCFAQTNAGLDMWTDVEILAGMMGFYLLVAFLSLQLMNKEKR